MSILRLFFNGKFVDSGRNLVSPSGLTWSCGKIWSSMAAICLYRFCVLGWMFGNADVSGKCGFTVHKSINAYRSASDTSASVFKSSLSIWSLGLL